MAFYILILIGVALGSFECFGMGSRIYVGIFACVAQHAVGDIVALFAAPLLTLVSALQERFCDDTFRN